MTDTMKQQMESAVQECTKKAAETAMSGAALHYSHAISILQEVNLSTPNASKDA